MDVSNYPLPPWVFFIVYSKQKWGYKILLPYNGYVSQPDNCRILENKPASPRLK